MGTRGTKPIDLRLNGHHSPIGVDDRTPAFSWRFAIDGGLREQTAYRILVASNRELLADDVGDAWDTGRVESTQSAHVRYEGKPLASNSRYHWKVRAWDAEGGRTAWSEPASWRTGLRESEWSAEWIGPGVEKSYDPEHAGLLFRRAFSLDAPVERATAYVCGLGYYELFVNGGRVSDRVLDPAFTDYEERVMYATYDVTDGVDAGENAIGVHLGGGWYDLATPDRFDFQDSPWTAPPRLLFQLEVRFSDGRTRTVVSDERWRWTTGPVIFNCVRGGETYDARKALPGWETTEYDDATWNEATTVPALGGRLVSQQHQPVRVTHTHVPETVTEPEPGVYVFDLGTTIAGWPRIRVSGERGQTVRMRCGGALDDAGLIDEAHGSSHTDGRYQTDELILSGAGEDAFEPRFTYHGFRYVQVEGLTMKPSLDAVAGREVHTDLRRTATFECSDSRIDDAIAVIDHSYRNYVHHHPEDPTREKMGWTQDAFNLFEAGMYYYDAGPVYRKWFRDMVDGQEPNGHVPPIDPANGWGTTDENGAPPDWSDPWWGGAIVYLPWYYYQYTGDSRLIEDNYDAITGFVEYLRGRADEHRIDWWLGDWLEMGSYGRPERTPIEQTSTCGYYYCVKLAAACAKVAGERADAAGYRMLAERIAESFHSSFFDADTGRYAENSQTAQILPLWLGMVPTERETRVIEAVIDDVRDREGHLSTGFVGTKPLLKELTNRGHADLAYEIATQEEPPGLFPMVADGVTNESWTVRDRDVHLIPNLAGPFALWFWWAIGGIRLDPAPSATTAAIQERIDVDGPFEFQIAPEPVGDISSVEATCASVHGDIVSKWTTKGDRFVLDAAVPPNTVAHVRLPTSDVSRLRVDGRAASEHDAVEGLSDRDERVACRTSAGRHRFTVEPFDRPGES